MIDLYLYGRDGDALTGVVPTPLHVVGDQLTGDAYHGCQQAFLRFSEAYRLAVYDSAREEIRIDAETVLELTVIQGVFQAVATVKREEGEAFFGGIVVQLQTVTSAAQTFWSDATFVGRTGRGAALYPEPGDRVLIPEMARKGTPTVPGLLGEDTNTLVVQIARNGSLGVGAVRAGTVKIWRIRSPKVGSIISHNVITKGYLVSAEYTFDDLLLTSRIDFYFVGRRLDIPSPFDTLAAPIPLTGPGYSYYYSDQIRLFTLGFEVARIDDADLPRGVILLATFNRLYAYDMRATTPQWVLLDQFAYPPNIDTNIFGLDFTVTNGGGATTVKCSGSNSYGPATEFVVTINAAGIKGALHPMHYERLTPDNGHLAYSKTVNWTNTFYANNGANIPYDLLANDYAFTASYSHPFSQTGPVRDDFLDRYISLLSVGPRLDYSAAGSFAPHISLLTTGGFDYWWNDTYLSTYSLTGFFYSPQFGRIDFSKTWDQPAASAATVSFNPVGGFVAPFDTPAWPAMDRHKKSLTWRSHYRRDGGVWGTGSGDGVDLAASTMGMSIIDRQENVRFDFGDYYNVFPSQVSRAGVFSTIFTSLGLDTSHQEEKPSFAGEVPTDVEAIQYLPHWLWPFPDHPDSTLRLAALPPPITGIFWFSDNGGTVGSVTYPSLSTYAGNFTASVAVTTTGIFTYTLGAYQAIGDLVVPDYAPRYTLSTWGPERRVNPVSPIDDLYDSTSYSVLDHDPDIQRIDDRLYVDARTGGYIAQSFAEAKMESSGDIIPRVTLLAGNEDGTAPLVDLINEWASLQDASYVDGRMFIARESARDASLI